MGKRALVEDWGEDEDHKLVITQIPKEFHEKIVREAQRKRNGQWWVHVGIPEGLTNLEVKEELEKHMGTP